jgi:hypothetical protein
MKFKDFEIGEKQLFTEHLVKIIDTDSLSEMPVTVYMRDGLEDIEERAIKTALRSSDNVFNLTGNHLEGEYLGTTGAQQEAEWTITKASWIKTQQLKERDPDFDMQEYYKID